MTAALPKRLIEVDLPIKRISAHARAEKDSRCAHIPRLHIYPAARPLAACRAVICAALWPDPVDENCPLEFIEEAQVTMREWASHNLKLCGATSLSRFIEISKSPQLLNDRQRLRTALLDFIADFSDWNNSAVREFLTSSRRLTAASHAGISGGTAGHRPIVIDPFAGGGAIPLEAARVGAEAIASDSNPLAVLINSVVLQFAPKYGRRLADDVEKWGNGVNAEVTKVLAQYYPADSIGRTPIVYLWARTVLSEAPDEHEEPVEVPLIRSMWLSKKGQMWALRWRKNADGKVATERVSVGYANGVSRLVRRPILEVFQPRTAAEVSKGTVARNSATCPVTRYTTPARSVQRQLTERHGGADDARLYCVVSTVDGQAGRSYSLPTSTQFEAFLQAKRDLKGLLTTLPSLLPNEPLPVMSGVFNAPLYGHSTWGSLFNSRQLLALNAYIKSVHHVINSASGTPDYQRALAAVLGLAIDRLADLNASLCGWQLSTPNSAHVFIRWALPMIMDYAEVNPLAGAGGSPESAVWRIAAALRDIAAADISAGEVLMASADTHPMPDDSVDAFITDPPYYNAVPYADISDFFYVWLKRVLVDVFPELFATELSPKATEICEMSGWDPERYSHKDKDFFERKMREVAVRAREYLKPSGIGVVVFAHKTTAGWEAMLNALIDAGWTITASWPIDTEMVSRLRARNSATLVSSVHLVCRPREGLRHQGVSNHVGDWRDVLRELPRRIHEWMPRLAEEGVVGADAIFACLGPALEIFSRHSRVEKASGAIVSLKDYLEHVWAVVSQEALSTIFAGASTEGFEPDARLTAMWLWTLSAGGNGDGGSGDEDEGEDENATELGGTAKLTKGFVIEYDAARKIAQGLGANLESLASVVEVKGEIARLIPVAERTRKLFGKDEADSPARAKPKKAPQLQLEFVEELEQAEKAREWGSKGVPELGFTVLDRVHQCMILFAAGRAEAVRRFLLDEGVGTDERFWRLAQALSYLYPKASDEKRWIDGVLARKKSLGF